MPSVTLKKACELTSKSKRTIQRYMANGKLSYKTNSLGHKEIDISELMRVFGDLSPLNDDKVRPDDTPKMSPHENDKRIDKLLLAVEELTAVVEQQSEQIASLLKLEHKPKPEPINEEPTPTKEPSKVKDSYLYDIPTFGA